MYNKYSAEWPNLYQNWGVLFWVHVLYLVSICSPLPLKLKYARNEYFVVNDQTSKPSKIPIIPGLRSIAFFWKWSKIKIGIWYVWVIQKVYRHDVDINYPFVTLFLGQRCACGCAKHKKYFNDMCYDISLWSVFLILLHVVTHIPLPYNGTHISNKKL